MGDAVTYDPRDTTVIMDSVFITGFVDADDAISCKKSEDNVTPHVGLYGETDWAIKAGSLGTIVLKIKQTSPSNAHLNNLCLRKASFPARVINRNYPETVVGGSQCKIAKPADIGFGGNVVGREWTIIVADYDVTIKE